MRDQIALLYRCTRLVKGVCGPGSACVGDYRPPPGSSANKNLGAEKAWPGAQRPKSSTANRRVLEPRSRSVAAGG